MNPETRKYYLEEAAKDFQRQADHLREQGLEDMAKGKERMAETFRESLRQIQMAR